MAGNFRSAALFRLVAKQNSADFELSEPHAAEICRQDRIMIAGDPDPVASALQASKQDPIGAAEPFAAADVMERIAERDDGTRRVAGDQYRKSGKRRRRIIGRQEDAA